MSENFFTFSIAISIRIYFQCWSEMESRLTEPQSALDDLRMKNFDRGTYIFATVLKAFSIEQSAYFSAKRELDEQISELIKKRNSTKSENDLFIDDLINVASSDDQRTSIVLTYVFSAFHASGNCKHFKG